MLVVIVVFVFLQSWRAAIIPIVAIPVSLIGTFAVMAALGFSLNTLTLFGMVLAIGIVVDDAIVVVENVERNIAHGHVAARGGPRDHGRGRRARSSRSRWCSCAVFVPTAFIPGITGQFYRQFALTIAVSTVISAFNSLTLVAGAGRAAAQAAQPRAAPQPARAARQADCATASTAASTRLSNGYATGGRRASARHKLIVLPVYVGLLAGTVWIAERRAARLHPDARPGLCHRRRSSCPTAPRCRAPTRSCSEPRRSCTKPGRPGRGGVRRLLRRDLHQRDQCGRDLRPVQAVRRARQATASRRMTIIGDLFGRMQQIEEAFIIAIPPPPVRGLGNSGGFKMQLQERTGDDVRRVLAAAYRADGPARARTRTSPASSPPSRPTRPGLSRHRPRRRRASSTCRSRTSSRRCRSISAPPT